MFIVKNVIWSLLDGIVAITSLFFKKVFQNMYDDSYSDYGKQKNKINESESNVTLRCSNRIRNLPKRYEDYDMS